MVILSQRHQRENTHHRRCHHVVRRNIEVARLFNQPGNNQPRTAGEDRIRQRIGQPQPGITHARREHLRQHGWTRPCQHSHQTARNQHHNRFDRQRAGLRLQNFQQRQGEDQQEHGGDNHHRSPPDPVAQHARRNDRERKSNV